MIIVRSVKEMQKRAEDWRKAGKTIAFVPTMGFLHDGHISLMIEGRSRCDVLVTSIFVNPTQFAPTEDLSKYPRDFEGDEAKCRAAGVDAIYYPTVEEMYPAGYQTYVTVEQASQGLCGASRPTHFRGVATVVTKLFNAVKPHVAIFGDKDYQQLAVIRAMAKDLDMDIEIVGMPLIREPDGLAMSSRNKYLDADERKRSTALYRALVAGKKSVEIGERDPKRVEEIIRIKLADAQPCEIDYVEIRDAQTLEKIGRIEKPVVAAIAVKVGKTRLIDNVVIKTL